LVEIVFKEKILKVNHKVSQETIGLEVFLAVRVHDSTIVFYGCSAAFNGDSTSKQWRCGYGSIPIDTLLVG